jgi:hypothetical protein
VHISNTAVCYFLSSAPARESRTDLDNLVRGFQSKLNTMKEAKSEAGSEAEPVAANEAVFKEAFRKFSSVNQPQVAPVQRRTSRMESAEGVKNRKPYKMVKWFKQKMQKREKFKRSNFMCVCRI